MDKLIFATRPSALARWQTQWVIAALQRLHPGLACEEKIITTQGDRILDKPLPEIGGKGLFTHELERELLSGTVDCAVHSLKDLPVENTQGLAIGCIPERAEIRDAFISKSGRGLLELDPGSVVGTSSLRRSAQLLALRPDLVTRSLRGNVDTRVRKALQGEYDGIVVAGAGLCRLGLEQHVTEWIPLEGMLPAPGQGALAVQCRSSDQNTLQLLAALQDMPARIAVTAERAFLSGLGGGCSFPVAAYASLPEAGLQNIRLTGLVASPDGKNSVKVTGHGTEPEELGRRLALDAIAQGAWQILTAENKP
jgi:hydroxymethylbilane synthase